MFDSINDSRLVDFMDKSLVDFNNEELTKITLRTGDEIAQLTRDKKDSQNWIIEKPLITKASSATVNSLLFDLSLNKICTAKGPRSIGRVLASLEAKVEIFWVFTK